MTRAALLPSPFLPVHAYASLGDALRSRGWRVTVATSTEVPQGPAPVLAAYRDLVDRNHPDGPDGTDVVLAHSNAGRYAVTAADGVPVVYVDAALPPEAGEAPMAPEALLDHLAALADADGLLPPWTRWWSEPEIAAVVPDRQMLDRLRAGEPRLPLSYVRARLGAPSGWQDAPQAYLALGDTYADEVARAGRHGWPVEVLSGAGHLHHLVEPEAVAAAVVELAGRLGVASRGSAGLLAPEWATLEG